MARMNSTNAASTATIVIVVLLACIQISVSEGLAEKEWKTNCFNEIKNGKCEDSVIKILSDYYSCDMVMEIDAAPTKIGFVNGLILVGNGSHTFYIRNEELQVTSKKVFIPRWDEFLDKNKNKYYVKGGSTFVMDRKAQREIEILTLNDHSNSHIAFDMNDSMVLILSFNSGDIAGSLFAIDTDSINLDNEKVQAVKVDRAGEDITAMVVEGGFDKLLLGVRTPEGGKIIRITRQNENPCSFNDAGKMAIENFIDETKSKLLKIISDLYGPPQLNSRLVSPDGVQKSNAAETENKRLKRELFITKAKLDSFTSRLLTFNRHADNKPAKRPTNKKTIILPGQTMHDLDEVYESALNEPEPIHIMKTEEQQILPVHMINENGSFIECVEMRYYLQQIDEISEKDRTNLKLAAKYKKLSKEFDELVAIAIQPV